MSSGCSHQHRVPSLCSVLSATAIGVGGEDAPRTGVDGGGETRALWPFAQACPWLKAAGPSSQPLMFMPRDPRDAGCCTSQSATYKQHECPCSCRHLHTPSLLCLQDPTASFDLHNILLLQGNTWGLLAATAPSHKWLLVAEVVAEAVPH